MRRTHHLSGPAAPGQYARVPLVRPPRLESGGGFAAPNGLGAPGLAVAETQAQQDTAIQVMDAASGRFVERVLEWPPFAALGPGISTGAQTVQIMGLQSAFVRLVAMRGGLKLTNQFPLTGLESANLALRLQVDGENDLTTSGQQTFPSEFDGLFTQTAPWFWFSSPPRLRINDQLQATITNTFAVGGGGPTLTPYFMVRIVEDKWWTELYGT